MSVSDNYSPDVSIGNGVTTVFTGTWRVINEDYFKCIKREIATGTDTLLVQGSDYTLTFSDSGYQVTLASAPSSSYQVIRYREVAKDQTVPYKTSKGFQGSVIENSFDKLTTICQDLTDNVERTLRLPVGSSTSNVVLNEPVPNKALIWNATGTKIISSATDFDDAAAQAAAAEASAVEAEYWANQALISRADQKARESLLTAVNAFGSTDFSAYLVAGLYTLSSDNTYINGPFSPVSGVIEVYTRTYSGTTHTLQVVTYTDQGDTTLAGRRWVRAKKDASAWTSWRSDVPADGSLALTKLASQSAGTFVARLPGSGSGSPVAATLTATGAALAGAADAAAGRTALSLGTASTLNTGTANGDLPVLGTGGAQVVSSFTVANNGVQTVTMPSSDSVVMALIGSTSHQHGLFISRMGSTPFVSGTANFVGTTGALTGTTGTSGKLTISTSGSTLYIENRLGYTYTITVAAFHNGA